MSRLPLALAPTLAGSTPDTLEGTLLGSQLTLVGLDADSTIVLTQTFTRETGALSRSVQAQLPVVSYEEGHPFLLDETPPVSLSNAFLLFYPEDSATGTAAVAGGPTHTVERWLLIGVDSGSPIGTEALALSASFPAALEASLKAEGRFIVEWQGTPVSIADDAPVSLPLLLAGMEGLSFRRVVRTHPTLRTSPISYEVESPHESTEQALCLELRTLLGEAEGSTAVSDATVLGWTARALNDRILEQAKGPVVREASYLKALPSVDEVLLSVSSLPSEEEFLIEVGGVGYNFSHDEGAPEYRSTSSSGIGVLRHRDSFLWPVGKGVKLTAALVADDSLTYSRAMALKLAQVAGGLSSSPAVVEIVRNTAMPWHNRISSFLGMGKSLTVYPSPTVLAPTSGTEILELQGQQYEVYAYPDRFAYIYVNGEYLAELEVSDFAIREGEAYTLGLELDGGSALIRGALVESFEVPADYVPRVAPPRITAVTADNNRYIDDDVLKQGDGGYVITNAKRVEFTLTQRARLNIEAYVNYSGDRSRSARLVRLSRSGEPYSLLTESTKLEANDIFEAGRYALYVTNSSWNERRQRCVEWFTNGWTGKKYCSEYRTYYTYHSTNHSFHVRYLTAQAV